MKTLKLKDINNSKKEDFIINTETLFKDCYIYRKNNIPKIKMKFNSESNNLLETIELLYQKISEVIEINDDIVLSHVINPIYKPNNNKMLFSTINQKTIIKNVDNDKVIKLDDIDDKIFDIYPVLCCFNMNLYYDKIYINFSFHSIFVKIKKTYDIDIDYNNIKKLMNGLNTQ